MTLPLIMKWHCWPQADREAWVAHFIPGEDFIDEGGAGCDWTDGTRSKFEQTYGHWLAFLSRHHQLHDRAPVDRIKPETIRAFATETTERISGCSTADRIKDLTILATALGPTWIGRG